MADVFLICPVRGATDQQKKDIADYVKGLEDKGLTVYYPQRDTDQNDPVGYRICSDNRKAIEEAKEIHVWWTTTSTGTLFDLGMAWAMKKPLVIANPKEVVPTDGDKSFNNVLLAWGNKI